MSTSKMAHFNPGKLDEHILDHSMLDSRRRPSIRRPAHKRHVSGLSVGGDLDEFYDLSEPIATEDDVGILKRTKSMNNQDLSRLVPMLHKQVEDEDDITNISQRLASRRVSISSNNGDDDIANVIAGSSRPTTVDPYVNSMMSMPYPKATNPRASMFDDDEIDDDDDDEIGLYDQSRDFPGQSDPPAFNLHHKSMSTSGLDSFQMPRGVPSKPNQSHTTGTNASSSISNTELGIKRENGPPQLVQGRSENTAIDAWYLEDDINLKTLVEKLDSRFDEIATHIKTRSEAECRERWDQLNQANFKKGTWTNEEDARLQILHEGPSKRSWSDIACLIPGRSAKQCRERWCYNLDPNINKAIWKREEDVVLMDAQKTMGNKWAQIASMLPGRTENAVKTRYKSIMRAKKREWLPEEDEKIMKLHEKVGSRWEEIAQSLPNRTKNAVKTRYRLLSKGLASDDVEEGSPNQILRASSMGKLPIKEAQEEEGPPHPTVKTEVHQLQQQQLLHSPKLGPSNSFHQRRNTYEGVMHPPHSTEMQSHAQYQPSNSNLKREHSNMNLYGPVYSHSQGHYDSNSSMHSGHRFDHPVDQHPSRTMPPPMHPNKPIHSHHHLQQPRQSSQSFALPFPPGYGQGGQQHSFGVNHYEDSVQGQDRSVGPYANDQSKAHSRRSSFGNFYQMGNTTENYLHVFGSLESMSRSRAATASPAPPNVANQLQELEENFLNDSAPILDDDLDEFLDMWDNKP